MPNHVACERRKGGAHWRVLSTFAESAESRVYKRMPNQEWRHHTELCKSGISFHHGHGEDGAFAQLFCGMLRHHVLWEDGAFASRFSGMLRPDVLYAVMKVSPIYTAHSAQP